MRRKYASAASPGASTLPPSGTVACGSIEFTSSCGRRSAEAWVDCSYSQSQLRPPPPMSRVATPMRSSSPGKTVYAGAADGPNASRLVA